MKRIRKRDFRKENSYAKELSEDDIEELKSMLPRRGRRSRRERLYN